jgi:signal transduction histidine kinase
MTSPQARGLFTQMWRPLLGLLLLSFVVNALLVTGTLQLGSEAQTERRLQRIGEHWQQPLPDGQPLALDPVTTLYPAYAQLPAHIQALLGPQQRGLVELGPRSLDYFVLARELPGGRMLYVVENHAEVKPQETLEGQVIGGYLLGMLPFSALLLWLCRRVTARVATPLQQIGQQLAERPAASLAPLDLPVGSPAELQALVGQLNAALLRTGEALERERSFTRFASHELRTPVAVVQAALERLAGRATPEQQPALARAGRGLRDMQALIDTFLALAREASPPRAPATPPVTLDAAWLQALHQHLSGGQARQALVVEASAGPLQVAAPETVLHVLVANLLKNAAFHGSGGAIRVRLDNGALTVLNERPATPAGGGHGLGVPIAQRICQHFGWRFTLTLDPGLAQATLHFT